MVLFLNYLPWVVLFGLIGLSIYMWTKGKWQAGRSLLVTIGAFVAFALIQAATPSYMPKAEVKHLPNPSFEQPAAEVEDRLKKPELTTEEREKRFDEKFDAVKQATEK